MTLCLWQYNDSQLTSINITNSFLTSLLFLLCPFYLKKRVTVYILYEGHLESSYYGIITPQCVDKMLSNNTFLETRIQQLLDGLIYVEKGLGGHVQRMLKMSRVYTLAEILRKTFVKKRRKIGDLFYDHGLTN